MTASAAPGSRRRAPYRDRGKSEAILQAACVQFSCFGFDGTSIDSIAAVSRVTKATIYAKFGSKHHLFVAALESLRQSLPTPEALVRGPDGDVPAHLRAIARRVLELTLHPTTLGIYRMLILPLESAPQLGRTFWKSTVMPYRNALEDVLRQADGRGALAIADPGRGVSQFFSLVIGDPTLQLLLNAWHTMPPREQEAHVREAVALFMAGHERAPARVPRKRPR